MRRLNIFIIILALSVMDFSQGFAKDIEEEDRNGDGKTDSTLIYKDGVRYKRLIDRDFDGVVETWDYYDHMGVRRRTEFDRNGDGNADEWRYYEQSSIKLLREYDRNFDGKVDKRVFTEFTYDRNIKSNSTKTYDKERCARTFQTSHLCFVLTCVLGRFSFSRLARHLRTIYSPE